MTYTWITTSSPHIEAMVNSLTAACEKNFVPDHCYVLESPDVETPVEEAIDHIQTIVQAYGGDELTIHRTTLDDEVEFDRIHAHVRDAIEDARGRDDTVAVDITPGRKFMSAIAFAAGMRYGADHVFYFYVSADRYYGQLYPEIPRSATQLYDFVEAT